MLAPAVQTELDDLRSDVDTKPSKFRATISLVAGVPLQVVHGLGESFPLVKVYDSAGVDLEMDTRSVDANTIELIVLSSEANCEIICIG